MTVIKRVAGEHRRVTTSRDTLHGYKSAPTRALTDDFNEAQLHGSFDRRVREDSSGHRVIARIVHASAADRIHEE